MAGHRLRPRRGRLHPEAGIRRPQARARPRHRGGRQHHRPSRLVPGAAPGELLAPCSPGHQVVSHRCLVRRHPWGDRGPGAHGPPGPPDHLGPQCRPGRRGGLAGMQYCRLGVGCERWTGPHRKPGRREPGLPRGPGGRHGGRGHDRNALSQPGLAPPGGRPGRVGVDQHGGQRGRPALQRHRQPRPGVGHGRRRQPDLRIAVGSSLPVRGRRFPGRSRGGHGRHRCCPRPGVGGGQVLGTR